MKWLTSLVLVACTQQKPEPQAERDLAPLLARVTLECGTVSPLPTEGVCVQPSQLACMNDAVSAGQVAHLAIYEYVDHGIDSHPTTALTDAFAADGTIIEIWNDPYMTADWLETHCRSLTFQVMNHIDNMDCGALICG
jgi:hypothetical protein